MISFVTNEEMTLTKFNFMSLEVMKANQRGQQFWDKIYKITKRSITYFTWTFLSLKMFFLTLFCVLNTSLGTKIGHNLSIHCIILILRFAPKRIFRVSNITLRIRISLNQPVFYALATNRDKSTLEKQLKSICKENAKKHKI